MRNDFVFFKINKKVEKSFIILFIIFSYLFKILLYKFITNFRNL